MAAKPKAKPKAKTPAKKAAAVKKAPAAKKAVRKAPEKSAAAPAAPVAKKKSTTPVAEKFSKTQIIQEISDATALSKKQVGDVLEELSDLIERHINKKACGEFTLPGLIKIKTIKKPARKAKKGVPNPFKPGELMDVAAKPASVKVKTLPLKKLKEMVE